MQLTDQQRRSLRRQAARAEAATRRAQARGLWRAHRPNWIRDLDATGLANLCADMARALERGKMPPGTVAYSERWNIPLEGCALDEDAPGERVQDVIGEDFTAQEKALVDDANDQSAWWSAVAPVVARHLRDAARRIRRGDLARAEWRIDLAWQRAERLETPDWAAGVSYWGCSVLEQMSALAAHLRGAMLHIAPDKRRAE